MFGWVRPQSSTSARDMNQVGQTSRYTSRTLLEAVRLSRDLRGGGRALNNAVQQAGTLLGAASQPAAASEAKGIAIRLPKKSTLQAAELSMDVAMMLHMRRKRAVHGVGDVLRWALADSSPQQQHDWVWLQYHEMRVDAVSSAVEAVFPNVPKCCHCSR